MLKSIFNRTTERELGFGTTATINGRLMDPDGRFRVRRTGAQIGANFFHFLLTMSWRMFSLLVFLFFFALNLGFATAYTTVGIEHLSGIEPGSWQHNFTESFFFSTQTLTTVGYGRINPMGFWTNILASVESLLGLLSFALISGLMYGRFSRPTAKILFSKNMLVAPHQNGQGLMFRMANARRSELLETEVSVMLAINQMDEKESMIRRFYNLELQLAKITFFSLNWTIVHKMDEKSPISGLSRQELMDARAEFLVLVKGIDDTYAQQVHARTSFVAEELVWNAKFSPIVGHDKSGQPEILLRRLDDFKLME